jgi:ABC-2 type transport system permease protein
MKHYLVFLKKEIIESIRTKKLFIVLVVFMLLGVLNPLTAKITPEIIKNLAPGGNQIELPEPSAIDSLAQFFKNTKQMGLIVFLITFSGILTNEISKGSLINVLTKGLTRKSVILSKHTLMTTIWSLSIIISFSITWLYTVNLFPKLEISNLLFSIFCIWLFGIYFLTILLFASILVNSNYGNLLILGAVSVISIIMNISEKAQRYNPLTLSVKNMDLIEGVIEPSYMYPSIGITIGISLILIFASIAMFKKKQIT